MTIPRQKWTRLLNTGPVILLGTTGRRGHDLCTIAWSMPMAKDPPTFVLEVGRGHLSFENLMATGELVINLPTIDLVDRVLACGRVSGRDVDKWTLTGFSELRAEGFSTPGIAQCCASIWCRVEDPDLALARGLVVARAEVVVTARDLMRPDWTIDVDRYPLIHHLGGDSFYRPGELVTAAPGPAV